jgi:hypothetical protein
VLVFKLPLFYLIIAPECKCGDVKEAPRCKIWKDRLTLVLCGSAAGHREQTLHTGFSTALGFRHSLGGLARYPVDNVAGAGGLLC